MTDVARLVEAVEADLGPAFAEDERREGRIYARLIEAFADMRLSEADLGPRTGYAFDNAALEKLERIFARAFGARAALVRPQMVSGTHALTVALEAMCPPGTRLLLVGRPYESLNAVIGHLGPAPGSLAERGVEILSEPASDEVREDPEGVAAHFRPDVVFLRRSRGYGEDALDIAALARLARAFRSTGAATVVDNCYGEFVEEQEPTAVGATLAIGSLIKNPGGALAPAGGYAVGEPDAVRAVARRLFGPALGASPGPVPEGLRVYAQGLFLAPHFVSQAVQTGRLFAGVFEALGYDVAPAPLDPRTDTVIRLRLGSAERLEAAARALQGRLPVDAHVRPEPGPLPGYGDPVIMTSGGFVPGGSLELSADAPLRPPFDLFLQGGVSRQAAKPALIAMAKAVGPREGTGAP